MSSSKWQPFCLSLSVTWGSDKIVAFMIEEVARDIIIMLDFIEIEILESIFH